ncbi:MAG: sugar phosphate isomerase/epimerase [Candidatus Omnitrophica bacterium]|nr:sugar phosphate isomerase/epimerase [Candidatus Omnitrophota bacterium]
MLALSTSWNANTSNSGKQIVEEIKNLGFDCIELCFSHTQGELSQIYKNQGIRVTSLHNFCPIPDGLIRKKALPDCFSLSSPNNAVRKKAVKFTKRTILFAKKFKAKTIVLHTGRVEVRDYTKQLIKLKCKKRANSCEFESLRELAIKEREDNKERFLENIFISIRELSDFAYNLGIPLGIENRIYIREIPNFDEIKIFLDNFYKKGVYYWHDTGHAYILEKLGFAKHTDYLKAYSEYLLGIHFHDVKGFVDHKAPFSGEIDFKILKRYIKKNTIKVIEAHKPATAKEIIASRQKLEKLFN